MYCRCKLAKSRAAVWRVADKIADCTTLAFGLYLIVAEQKNLTNKKRGLRAASCPPALQKSNFGAKFILKYLYNTFILFSAVAAGCKLWLAAGGHCRIFVVTVIVLGAVLPLAAWLRAAALLCACFVAMRRQFSRLWCKPFGGRLCRGGMWGQDSPIGSARGFCRLFF